MCFHCDEKWSLNHVCSKKEISVLIGTADEEEQGEELVVEEIVVKEEMEAVNISLNSVVEITNPKTIKLLSKIGENELVVMIDP